ncbi:MAG: alginate export family protein [Verrucomicrobiota bacterium]
MLLVSLAAWPGPGAASVVPRSKSHPSFQQLRFDEDYSYLRDPALRADAFDTIKFIPLNARGSAFLSTGGEIRERFEYVEHNNWGRGPADQNGYLLHRYVVHADWHEGDQFRFFAAFKSGLEEGRSGGPRPTDRDRFDLHQAFADLRALDMVDRSLTLRLGRQELAYGSSRLISVREGPNVRLSFDGAKGMWKSDSWQVDAFAVKPARTQPGVFDDDPDPHQSLWGIYSVAAVPPFRGAKVDLYYLGLERGQARFDQGAARETRHSFGGRIWGRDRSWDYNFEAVYQYGTFGHEEIHAWTVASDTGYTLLDAPFSPRFGLKANITSGDQNPEDAGLQTFNPLFPRGAYFGEPALIGPANHIDVHPSVDLNLSRRLRLNLNWDLFWRESVRDGIYGPALNLIRSGRDSNERLVGHQFEALLEWRLNRHLLVTADYAHFFTGPFLEETTPGEDVDYFSTWLTFRF